MCRIDIYNESKGDLTGYNCDKCKNRGYFMMTNSEGYDFLKECDCMKMRRLIKVAQNCGLGDALKKCKLHNFEHKEKWQDDIYMKAVEFLNDTNNAFYIGGQVGAGKSHICTGIIRELVLQGKDCYYVVWSDVITKLKQNIMDNVDEYTGELQRLKEAEVLYIDDFFKNEPTKSDLDNAFKIINYRYNLCRTNSGKRIITILSSEKTIMQLAEIDEAIASRIAEMCGKKYIVSIDKNLSKNMRLKGI